MTFNNKWLQKELDSRSDLGLYRTMPDYAGLIDFCSNDYLGISKNGDFNDLNRNYLHKFQIQNKEGATGSRLISGNSTIALETEKFIAKFHGAEAALIYSTGYAANVGILSAVAKRGDVVLTDEHIHASLIDGARLSNANRYQFKHNNLQDLETKLKKTNVRCFVVVESIYSMDGDRSPLVEIAELCNHYGAYLIVDEAHAIGIYGNNGNGIVSNLGLEDKVWARIATYGKAMGTHGAAILGSQLLIDYLVNFSRSFIYSTALPPAAIASIFASYQLIKKASDSRELLKSFISHFKKQAEINGLATISSDSAIQGVYVENNIDGKNKEMKLRTKGLACKAILSPTVPKGKERLRVSLHSYNTTEEINFLISTLTEK
jgi:8-amino-7-oxononanoate synthase